MTKLKSFINNLAQDGSSWTALIKTIKDGQYKYVQKKFYRGSSQQNKQAALDWLSNQERIRAGLSPSFPMPTTLAELAESYLERVRSDVKPVTLEGYNRLLQTVLSSLGPSHSLEINQYEIDQYVQDRLANGAGRGIIAELNVLHYAFNEFHYPISWSVSKKLYRIPKQERHVPSVGEFSRIYQNSTPVTKSALSMAIYCGLRDGEVYRVGWDSFDHISSLFHVFAAIRKNKVGNVLPVVNTLKKDLSSLGLAGVIPATGSIIPVSKSVIKAELGRHSGGKIVGLQPFRRLLVSLAEDAGYHQDQIALVTGHARTHMTSRYSHGAEQLELKRKILESVEQRIMNGYS